jgi:hypothetical protein
MTKGTVRIFRLTWVRQQDVYSTRDKEKQCVHAVKGTHGNMESRLMKKTIILKRNLRKWSLYARYIWL